MGERKADDGDGHDDDEGAIASTRTTMMAMLMTMVTMIKHFQ